MESQKTERRCSSYDPTRSYVMRVGSNVQKRDDRWSDLGLSSTTVPGATERIPRYGVCDAGGSRNSRPDRYSGSSVSYRSRRDTRVCRHVEYATEPSTGSV